MRRHPLHFSTLDIDTSDEDRRTYRRWTGSLAFIYGALLGLALAAVVLRPHHLVDRAAVQNVPAVGLAHFDR